MERAEYRFAFGLGLFGPRTLTRACLAEMRAVVPRVGLENTAIYFVPGDPLGEPDFINAILGDSDHLLLDLEPAQAKPIFAHLDKYIIADDVTLEDATGQQTTLALEANWRHAHTPATMAITTPS